MNYDGRRVLCCVKYVLMLSFGEFIELIRCDDRKCFEDSLPVLMKHLKFVQFQFWKEIKHYHVCIYQLSILLSVVECSKAFVSRINNLQTAES